MKKVLKDALAFWRERRFRKLDKISTEKVFENIYASNVWGGKKGEFYSGDGSRNEWASIYAEWIKSYVTENNIKSILDIGCGDFQVMKQALNGLDINYLGIDIVGDLIAHNQKTYGSKKVQFKKLDAITEPLPPAHMVTIRQVLQHLNNQQIQSILNKISAYAYLAVTEHVPLKPSSYNADKTHGPHIRTRTGSGVFIDQPPFEIKNTSVALEYRADEKIKKKIVPAVLRTYLVKNE